MKILQNLKIKEFPYFLPIIPVCLIAAALVSALPATASDPAEFILGWDANEEADLDGYEIYFRKGAPGPTYDFLAEVYVDELEDPDKPTVTITDLDNSLLNDLITPVVRMDELANNSTYHFALTAFDTQGKTSDFSEELCVEVIGTSVVECRSADSGVDNDGFAEKSIVSGDGDADSDGFTEKSVVIGSSGADYEGSAEKSAVSGSGGADYEGSAEKSVVSGSSGADYEGSAEKSVVSGSGGADSDGFAEKSVVIGSNGADNDGSAEKSAVSGSGGDNDGSAEKTADSGSDNDGSAEKTADSGSSSGDSGGFAEIGADNSSSGGDSGGSAEKTADSGGGGGCFIAASSFVFRETVVLWFSPF